MHTYPSIFQPHLFTHKFMDSHVPPISTQSIAILHQLTDVELNYLHLFLGLTVS